MQNLTLSITQLNNYIKNIDLAGISNYFQNTSSGFIEFSDSKSYEPSGNIGVLSLSKK